MSRVSKIHQQREAGESRRSKHKLLGVPIGPQCLAAVLGIGTKRLARAVTGQLDLRFSELGGAARLSPKTDTVDKFLLELHGSVAETLPTQLLGLHLQPVSKQLFPAKLLLREPGLFVPIGSTGSPSAQRINW